MKLSLKQIFRQYNLLRRLKSLKQKFLIRKCQYDFGFCDLDYLDQKFDTLYPKYQTYTLN